MTTSVNATRRVNALRMMLMAAVSAVALSTAVEGVSAAPVDTFYRSGKYTYCDARLLANYWRTSTWQAKNFAGRKIESGNRRTLEVVLRTARIRARQRGLRCQWNDAGNSYRDAVALARYWNYPTPWRAKLKMRNLLERGLNWQIRRSLASARRAGRPGRPGVRACRQQPRVRVCAQLRSGARATFSNACFANLARARVLYAGVCR